MDDIDDALGCLFGLAVLGILVIFTVAKVNEIGHRNGYKDLANQIADGTHTVEVQEFSDGTREVRIVEVE